MRLLYKPDERRLLLIIKYIFKMLFLFACIVVAFCASNKYISQLNLLEDYSYNNCFEGENKEMI